MADFWNDIDGPLSPAYTQHPPAYNFEGHDVVIVILQGPGQPGPHPKITCKEADQENSPCQPGDCQMKELYDTVGWDVFKSESEIELLSLSARIDWSDPEEPWIELETK